MKPEKNQPCAISNNWASENRHCWLFNEVTGEF